MKVCIIIPVYNEEAYLEKMLRSLVEQTFRPHKIVIVNDSSTDHTQNIIDSFVEKYTNIEYVISNSKAEHEPGSKVVNAFYKGFETLKLDFDLIGKFDGDIILPKDYIEKTITLFTSDKQVGIAGGNLYIEDKGTWIYEAISEKDKVRGPIKLYRRECFNMIGGLKRSIGWDTVDELLAKYHGWKVVTDPSLHVKHLKPTGKVYSKASKYKQGEAFYKMRYGILLTQIASAKLALKKNDFSFYFDCIRGFNKAKRRNLPLIVSEEEGEFIRNLRWEGIKKKIL